MSRIDNPLMDHEVGVADSTEDSTRIDDVRIGAVRPLISPALLQDELPVPSDVLTLVEKSRVAIADILHGRDDRLVAVVGSVFDPRSRSGARVRAPPESRRRCARRRVADRDARLLREAAHDGRLEGLHQRSAARRQLSHQRRAAARAAVAARCQRHRPADRHRIPRPAEPAIHRGPDRVGRDRRAHDREPEPSAARVGHELPDRLQERHRRRRADRGGRDRRGAREPRVHGHDEDGHGGDLRDARQRRRARDPARRQEGSELRPRIRRGMLRRAQGGRVCANR